jgi:glycosyltransferase involved in cell wall biosynthesis
MENMSLAVLIPTWKRAEKLNTCLEHLTKQELTPTRVYVVYREEDPESKAVIDQYLEKLPLTPVLVETPGVVHAENAGLKHVKEDIICFLDDDAYAPAHWTKIIHRKLSESDEIIGIGGPDIIIQDLASGYRRVVETVGQLSWYGRLVGNHHHEVKKDSYVDILKGVNMSFKRKYVPMLDEELQSSIREGNGSQWELDICMQMSKHGKFLFTPEIELNHDSNHSHFIADKVAVNNARNYTYVILKNFSFFKKLAFLLYIFVMGNTNAYGVMKCLIEFLRQRRLRVFRIYTLNLLGIFKGIRTYISVPVHRDQ